MAALSLCTPAGGLIELSPEIDPELFYATLGGMGLTGVVVEATLRAEPLPSPWVSADVDRTDGLEQTLELMSGAERHRYSVAWLDLLADGSKMGRAIVSRADPLASDARLRPPGDGEPRAARTPARSRGGRRFEVPRGFPAALMRPASMRMFNALRWRAAPRCERGRPLAMAPYFFPLDALGEWNRLYGSAGLIQYQFVIPSGQEARAGALLRADAHTPAARVSSRVQALRSRVRRSALVPARRLDARGRPTRGAPGLRAALDELDEVVAGCGGRVYLTKDARLRRETMAAMYPELDRFHAQRARWIPRGCCARTSHGVWDCARPRCERRGRRLGGRRVLVLGGTSEIALAIVGELQRRDPREVALAGPRPRCPGPRGRGSHRRRLRAGTDVRARRPGPRPSRAGHRRGIRRARAAPTS